MCSVNGCLTFEIEKAHICKYMPVSNQNQEGNGRVFKFFEEITDFILLITSRGHPLPTIFTRRHVHFHIAIRYLDMVKTSLTHSMRGFCFIVFFLLFFLIKFVCQTCKFSWNFRTLNWFLHTTHSYFFLIFLILRFFYFEFCFN